MMAVLTYMARILVSSFSRALERSFSWTPLAEVLEPAIEGLLLAVVFWVIFLIGVDILMVVIGCICQSWRTCTNCS